MWSGTSYLWFTNLVGTLYILTTNQKHSGKRFYQSLLLESLPLWLKNPTNQLSNWYQLQLTKLPCHHLFQLNRPRKLTSYRNISKIEIPWIITNPRMNQRQPNLMLRPPNPLPTWLMFWKSRMRFQLLMQKKSIKLTISSKELLSQSLGYKWPRKGLPENRSSSQ